MGLLIEFSLPRIDRSVLPFSIETEQSIFGSRVTTSSCREGLTASIFNLVRYGSIRTGTFFKFLEFFGSRSNHGVCFSVVIRNDGCSSRGFLRSLPGPVETVCFLCCYDGWSYLTSGTQSLDCYCSVTCAERQLQLVVQDVLI